VADTWDDRARKEFDKPDEPISARASDLTKIGAPVAAFLTAILAAVGGWVSDAPKAETVIAVAVVSAAAVGGLFYVFAADFKSRAAATVARFESVTRLATAQAQATDAGQAEADTKVKAAEAASQAHIEEADKAKAAAEKERAEAAKAREDAIGAQAEADQRVKQAESKLADAETEIAALKEALRKRQEGKPPAVVPPDLASEIDNLLEQLVAWLRGQTGRDVD
jgi:colicin import membrane protein